MNRETFAAVLFVSVCTSLGISFLVYAVREDAKVRCYEEADFARANPRFFVYQSEFDRCAKSGVNIPAVISQDFHEPQR